VPDGRRVPLSAALSSGDSVGVQGLRDCTQRIPAPGPTPYQGFAGEGRRPARAAHRRRRSKQDVTDLRRVPLSTTYTVRAAESQQARVRARVRARELHRLRPARTRSTFASNALAAGVTVFELARVMGTSVRMIERHYGVLLEGANAGIAGLLDALEAELEQAADDEAEAGEA
jgi:hypothetical protein